MIKFEIQRQIEKLRDAVAARNTLNRVSMGLQERAKAEMPIHHAGRTLWNCYRDEEQWDGTDTETRRAVRMALANAFQCTSQNDLCVESVFRRLKAFDSLVRQLNL